MKLKITKAGENERSVRLLIEGMITHPGASQLQALCHDYLQRHKQIELDCADIDFVDAKGAAVLNEFPRAEVTLLHAPRFVRQLLRGADRS